MQKHLPPHLLADEQLLSFLQAVNASYLSYERDHDLSERAFKISEEEFVAVNNQLKEEVALKRLSIEQLKEAILGVAGEALLLKSDNLPDIVHFLKEQIQLRKEAEETRATTANRLAFLISNMQTGILVEDETRHIVLTNQVFCDMFGIAAPPEMLTGADCSGAAEQNKVLFKQPARFVERIKELLANKELVVNEELRLVDGRIFERNYIPIFIDKVYKGHLWNYKDITERIVAEQAVKRREEKYRNIIANMNLGLLEVDNDGLVQYANHRFCEMSGYATDELTNRKAASLFTFGENNKIIQEKAELRKKGISDAYELAVKNKRGELKWWLISGAPLYDDAGELAGSIGIYLDFTDRKKLEFDLYEAREAAEQSARAKENFLANMSHEIRTPMNAILGMSRQLEKTSLNSEQRRYLQTVHTATDHLMVVINDILDMSKIHAGMLHLEYIGFNMEGVIRHAVQVMLPRAAEKQLGLSATFQKGILPVLLGDPHRLNQVLLNLLSNAIKFTEAGEVKVICDIEETIPGRQTIKVIVKDSGIGMDGFFLAKLFDKFAQEDNSVARKYGGTGLGMAITRQLVELMNGQITVTSEKGKGTEICCMIPFSVGTSADLPVVREKNSNYELLKGREVLVVEDYEMNRMVVSTLLKQYGVAITEAVDGEEAIAQLKQKQFDLVLMDVQMPVMGGIEATRQIRKHLKLDIPIIALTANAVKGESERCTEAGMSAYVSKPFEESELVNTMISCLDIKLFAAAGTALPLTPSENEELPLFNLHKLEKLGEGDPAFIHKMIQLFLTQVPASVKAMQEALEKGDYETIRALAHRLKPAINNMDIHSLKTVVRDIEITAEKEPGNETLPAWVATLEEIITRVTTELQTRFSLPC